MASRSVCEQLLTEAGITPPPQKEIAVPLKMPIPRQGKLWKHSPGSTLHNLQAAPQLREALSASELLGVSPLGVGSL